MKIIIAIIGAICIAFFLALGLTGCAAGVTDATDTSSEVDDPAPSTDQGGAPVAVVPPNPPPAPPATACAGPLAAELWECLAESCGNTPTRACAVEACGLLFDPACPPAFKAVIP